VMQTCLFSSFNDASTLATGTMAVVPIHQMSFLVSLVGFREDNYHNPVVCKRIGKHSPIPAPKSSVSDVASLHMGIVASGAPIDRYQSHAGTAVYDNNIYLVRPPRGGWLHRSPHLRVVGRLSLVLPWQLLVDSNIAGINLVMGLRTGETWSHPC
jgi:hypothetical protein